MACTCSFVLLCTTLFVVCFALIVSLLAIILSVSDGQQQQIPSCSGQPDGWAINNPVDCRSFWLCQNGEPLSAQCPHGHNFNQLGQICDLHNDYPCYDGDTAETTAGSPSWSSSTSSPPPTTTLETSTLPPTTFLPPNNSTIIIPDFDDLCVGRPNGYLVNNPINCESYFICVNQSPTDAQCEPGISFNQLIQNCDPNLRCPSDDDDDNDDDDENICPPTGIHVFKVESSCVLYKFCFAGSLSIRQCINGLHYDNSIGRCNFPELAKCKRDMCPEYNDPNNIITHPSESDCEAFYICYSGEPQPFKCASGLHWNQNLKTCDFPYNVECSNNVGPEIVCPDEPGIHAFPSPNDCAEYYFCSFGTPIPSRCPDGLLFDPQHLQCNFADQVECLV